MKLINTQKAEGTKVAGIYCGQKYTGKVSAVRCAARGFHYSIALDAPIAVFGMAQDWVNFYSGDDDAQTCVVL